MGNPITKVRNEAEAADQVEKQKMQEQMDILEKMIHGKLDNEKTKIIMGERNDQEIHSGVIVQMHRQINITESDKESQEISDAIGDFFSGELIQGMEKLVQLGAESVLGNDAMGEYETSDMLIVWSDNSLLRCDAYYYRWNFVAKGVIAEAEGVLGVLLIKRVVDLTKTDPQVLLWAISNQASRQGMEKNEVDKLVDSAIEAIGKVAELQKKVGSIEQDHDKEQKKE
jgi:hypothetical protein